ncbi:MAG: type II toxin-antitoxin system VapC family toxin [Betaproteobacteria bacterium]
MIVDSGVWIDHFSGRTGDAVRILQSALREGGEVLVLPVVIVQEVLQGTRNAAQFGRYARLLAPVPLARVPRMRSVAVAAGSFYARMRWRGVTIPPIDCFIAACAIASRRPLLTTGADFRRIAQLEARFQPLAGSTPHA